MNPSQVTGKQGWTPLYPSQGLILSLTASVLTVIVLSNLLIYICYSMLFCITYLHEIIYIRYSVQVIHKYKVFQRPNVIETKDTLFDEAECKTKLEHRPDQ